MKKYIICIFFIINLPLICSEYTVFELLKLYEKNSSTSQLNQVNMKIDETKLSEFEKNRWKKLSLELNPIKLKGPTGETVSKDLKINYNGFYYNIIKDNNNEKTEEIWGYSKNLYNSLFKNHFEKKDILLNKELNNLNNNKNLILGKKDVLDLIYEYKSILYSIKNSKFNMEESLKEKKILENKAKIDEASKYDIESNSNEIEALKNVLNKSEDEKHIVLNKISNMLKIKLEDDTKISDVTISKDIKKAFIDIEIYNANLKILNNKKEMEKLNIFQNIEMAISMDKVETGSSFSIEIIWTPLTDNLNQKLLNLNRESIEIEKDQMKNNIELEYQSNLNQFEFLENEYKRTYNHCLIGKEKYELVRNRFEKGFISYYDFLKLKNEFLEKESEFLKSKLELEKFWIKENLNL